MLDRWPLRLTRSVLSVFDCRECGGAEWYCRQTPPKEGDVVSEDHISLGALAYACNVYDAMTDFGSSFCDLQRRVNAKPDLDDPNHRLDLLKWLNAWGCRHLALTCHGHVSKELAGWYTFARDRLPGAADRLADMNDGVLEEFAELFDHLSSLPTREGERNGRRFPISFGPTAASKTLFALRPHAFLAWDAAIRKGFAADGSGASFVRFLKGVRRELREITEQCSLQGFGLEDLPGRLRRPESTAPQLVGEYYWITITGHVGPPPRHYDIARVARLELTGGPTYTSVGSRLGESTLRTDGHGMPPWMQDTSP